MKKSEVAHLIDHTILKPEATSADVARIVEEGARLVPIPCVCPLRCSRSRFLKDSRLPA